MLRSLPIVLGALLFTLFAAAPAANAAFNCDASAVRASVATAPAIEPLTANHGAASCTPQTAGGALPATPLPVTGGALFARTTFTGIDALSQVAGASAGLTDLTVTTLLPGLPIPAPDLSALPGGGVLTVPGIGTVDIRPALTALLAPTGPLLQVSGVTATASARCAGGAPALSGDSSLASLSVLGAKLSTTEPTEKSLNVIDSTSLDPSNIDISKVLAPTVDLSALQAALKPILDTLPTISVPAVAARVKVTPGEQSTGGDRLTRRALHVQISLAGTSLLDAVVGEASVGATGVDCGSIAAAALGLGPRSRCTTRRLTLIDVVAHGNRVALQGAADPRRFAGRTVKIVSRWDGRTVATPRVAKSGLFTASLALPPAAVRHTNRARYEAFIGSERSLPLKLDRRMFVTAVRPSGKTVTLSGRITRPLARPIQEISVTRRISCGNVRVVARLEPDAQGRFKVKLRAPRADHVWTFRFRTKVFYSSRFNHLYRTYTLPQYVVGS